MWEEFYEDQGWMVQRLEKLQMDLKVIAGMRPFSAINYIRKGVAYEDYLREYADVRRIPFEDLTDVLDELQENARGFETFEAWFEHIEQLREELEEQAKSYKTTDGVNLSTLHSSKGLEYDTVFLVDVNEKVMPNKKAVLNSAEGYIRRQLARNLNLRNTPEIRFILDESIEYGVNMSKLIDDVTKKDSNSHRQDEEQDEN